MTVHEILPLLQASSAAALISLIVWKSWEESANRIFAVFLLSMTLWGVTFLGARLATDLDAAIWWERISIIFVALTWVFFYHFALRYCNVKGWFYRLIAAYVYLAALIPLSLSNQIVEGMKDESYGNAPVWGPLFVLFIGPIFVLIITAIYQLNQVRKASTTYAERNRLLYFVIGGSGVVIGGVFDLSPAIEGTDIYPGTTLANLLFIILTSIAVSRYRLFDIQFTTFKMAPYVAMLILVGGVYFSILFTINHVRGGEDRVPIWLHLIFILLISFGVQQIWDKVTYTVSKLLYRGRYQHFEALERLQEEAQSISDPSTVETFLPQLINQAMQASHVYLLLPSHTTGDFKVISSNGAVDADFSVTLNKNGAMVKWLAAHREMLRRDGIEDMPELGLLTGKERMFIDEADGEFFVPLNSGERLVGLLVIGPKVDRSPYSWEEEKLLVRTANQMALTIENIQLYQASLEREARLTALSRLNKTMNVSLDMQSTYEIFAEELKKTIDVDWASIVLIEGDELQFFTLSTSIDTAWGQPGTTFPLENTAIQWVAQKKTTLVEPDLAQRRRFSMGDTHLEQGIKSIVHLPLFSKGEVFGAFIVGSSKPNAYTKSDVEFLEQVSTQLSLATENARLYSRERGERARLEAMNNQRDDFLGIISHELKTPLTSIKSSSELLSEELSKDKTSRKRLSENIRRSADRLETMLNDMLDMVQSQNTALQAHLRPTDIIPSVKNAVDLCSPPIEKKRQILDIRIPDSLPPVMADPESFEHILTNLLGNANKFTPRGGKITLNIGLNGHKIIMAVSDSGPGVPEEEHELIFEPFYRGELSRTDVKGMGVGLATVKQLVKLHGGTVCIESDSGNGSTFTVHLPIL